MSHQLAIAPLPTAWAPSAADVAGPSLLVNAPLDPTWAPWAERLTTLIEKACAGLVARERRARRVTVILTLANGQRLRRTLALGRSCDDAEDVLPAALGLLRLMMAERRLPVVRLGVQLAELVEGANQPIRFERYLKARRKHGLARVAGLMATCGAAMASLLETWR